MTKSNSLGHKVFDVVNKKVADKDRVIRARGEGVDMEIDRQVRGAALVFRFQDPDLAEVLPDSLQLSAQAEALILSGSWCQET